uniref:hypothetical protein n=1 Tax=Pseudonocardia sp. CA-138482 TaxID=3240023 RepID=UPI003F494C4C
MDEPEVVLLKQACAHLLQGTVTVNALEQEGELRWALDFLQYATTEVTDGQTRRAANALAIAVEVLTRKAVPLMRPGRKTRPDEHLDPLDELELGARVARELAEENPTPPGRGTGGREEDPDAETES